jgi:hypothetical protein
MAHDAPWHARLQPLKSLFAPGAADSVTTVPAGNCALQFPVVMLAEIVQLMPPTLLVTVPDPEPAPSSDSVKKVAKEAVTVFAASIVTVHGPVPVQPPPLHPVNVLPVVADAVSVTEVSAWNGVLHPVVAAPPFVMTQSIPAGLEVTRPLPVPAPATVSW